jgi:phosphate starvation-inducible PhoH-like protein
VALPPGTVDDPRRGSSRRPATSRPDRNRVRGTDDAGALFGQFDTNLVQIENRLGVYISARGNKVQIEGPRIRSPAPAMCSRDAPAPHVRQEIDTGAVDR